MDISGYNPAVQSMFKKKGINVGTRIAVKTPKSTYEGILMPKSQGDPSVIILKLDNGYNVGIRSQGARIEKKKSSEQKAQPAAKPYTRDPAKPTIAIISTGGTVASRIDYKTGAVYPLEGPEEIASSIPELTDICNVRTQTLFNVYSGDMEPAHWIALAKAVYAEIERGARGVIITHGTDTMTYTSAALILC